MTSAEFPASYAGHDVGRVALEKMSRILGDHRAQSLIRKFAEEEGNDGGHEGRLTQSCLADAAQTARGRQSVNRVTLSAEVTSNVPACRRAISRAT